MALKVKAVEKKIKFSKEDPGVYRYVMQPERQSCGQPKVTLWLCQAITGYKGRAG